MSSTATWILVAAIAIVILVLLLVMLARRRKQRRSMLQDRFGPEYDHAVEETGKRSHAERELQGRLDERERLTIRPLDPQERREFSDQWTEAQALFVDNPAASLTQADVLVQRVMRRRGYPVGDFDQRSAVLSVDHSQVLDEYRTAHEISSATERREGTAPVTTEEMRRGMNHYRSLFEVLLTPGEQPEGGGANGAGERDIAAPNDEEIDLRDRPEPAADERIDSPGSRDR